MKQVEHFRFMVPPDGVWRKQPRATRFMMSVEEAAEFYPGAVPIPETREIHLLPDTAEEHAASKFGHFQGYSSAPSEAEALAGRQRRIEFRDDTTD